MGIMTVDMEKQEKQSQQSQKILRPELHGIFPVPVYRIHSDTYNLDPAEKKEVEDIIKEGMRARGGNSISHNSYIFHDHLKKIKQFCEQQLKIYVEEVINPKKELDFYITQSWLNITKPGEWRWEHSHSNSIISGVFYISTEKGDNLQVFDPNQRLKDTITISPKEYNLWNSTNWSFLVNNNDLLLFPSWLRHRVDMRNESATADRISLAFNVFAKGTFGDRDDKTELEI